MALIVYAPRSFVPTVFGANIVQSIGLSNATTSTSFLVTTSSRLLATTTSTIGTSYTRVYATICNANANPVFLNLNADKNASSLNATAVVAAAAGYQACYEVTDRNLYQGSITASSTNETSTRVLVTDYVY